MRGSPTLSVCVTAHNCAERLPLILTEARAYADELIVAVDAASHDTTLEVARAYADRVFSFTCHEERAGRARIVGADVARCDWILFLDDDEGMDAAFPLLRDELLDAPVTHWQLPRRWLVGTDPPRHLAAHPWWPNWALRLARADPHLLVKPDALHSSLLAVGPGGREARTAILHYDRIDRTPAEIAAKVERYRAMGQGAGGDRMYDPDVGQIPCEPVDPPPLRPALVGPPRTTLAPVPGPVIALSAVEAGPGWAADVSVEHPAEGREGGVMAARAHVRNTGRITWMAPTLAPWPIIGLACRREARDGTLVDSARERISIPVPPGEATELLLTLPLDGWETGTHRLRWQMVSENEVWFDDVGSRPVVTELQVR